MAQSMTLIITLIAFAANSFFCRYALVEGDIKPGAFTLIRLLSAAVTLLFIVLIKGQIKEVFSVHRINCLAGIMLFGYALAFSFAYTHLSTGTGALILFGTVQLTLIMYHVVTGHHLSRLELCGIFISLIGFVLLVLPSASAPELLVAFIMIIAGICWAVFTILGKQVKSPVVAITNGFLLASLLSIATSPWLVSLADISLRGIGWALLSGVLASGLGYLLWYQIMKKISILQASVAQLAVPVIAYAMGSIFLGESITLISIISSCLVLGGILLIFLGKRA